MLNKKTLLRIKRFALKKDWNDAFGGKAKGNRHLFRVFKLAKFLARRAMADEMIVGAGALLHDVPLSFGVDINYKKNKAVLKKIIKNFNLTKTESQKIIESAASHEGTVRPKTLEAKIVHDADVLDKSGTLGIIRHAWKLANFKKTKRPKIADVYIKKIIDHILERGKKIQTPLAKKINLYLNVSLEKNDVKMIVRKTTKLARQNIVAEKIATVLFNELSPTERIKLKSQLNLSYLKKF